MTLKEQISKKINNLSNKELREVLDFLSFINYRSRIEPKENYSEETLRTLYKEFEEEDSELAEEGFQEFAQNLLDEDSK